MVRYILAALLLVAAAPGVLGQTYKCVDAKGKTQYSDKPARGCVAVKGEASAPKSSPQSGYNARDNFAREQVVRCGQARQAYKRGEQSDAVRETLRDCM